MIRVMRSRSKQQTAVFVLLCAVELVGITAVMTHHRQLGQALIGLGIVALGPYYFWLLRSSSR